MQASFLLSSVGTDRSGLVDSVADVVARHQGSWQESHIVRLAGQFAGVLRITCPSDQEFTLKAHRNDLTELEMNDSAEDETRDHHGASLTFEIVGHDQPGIIRRISSILAARKVNVEELETSLESAPMAEHLLYHTEARIRLPEGLKSSELITALEKLGPDLTVDLIEN